MSLLFDIAHLDNAMDRTGSPYAYPGGLIRRAVATVENVLSIMNRAFHRIAAFEVFRDAFDLGVLPDQQVVRFLRIAVQIS